MIICLLVFRSDESVKLKDIPRRENFRHFLWIIITVLHDIHSESQQAITIRTWAVVGHTVAHNNCTKWCTSVSRVTRLSARLLLFGSKKESCPQNTEKHKNTVYFFKKTTSKWERFGVQTTLKKSVTTKPKTVQERNVCGVCAYTFYCIYILIFSIFIRYKMFNYLWWNTLTIHISRQALQIWWKISLICISSKGSTAFLWKLVTNIQIILKNVFCYLNGNIPLLHLKYVTALWTINGFKIEKCITI